MSPPRVLNVLLLPLVLAACGEPAPADEPTPAEVAASGGEPEPVPEDESTISLGAATEELTIGEDVDNQLAALTLGNPADESVPAISAEPTPKPRPVDKGLGVIGGETITSDQILSTIQLNQGQVKQCYERELKSNAALRGKVKVSWTVGADGKVRSPRVVQNTTGNRSMQSCITAAIRGWRFPKAESPTDVEYPFKFKPKDY